MKSLLILCLSCVIVLFYSFQNEKVSNEAGLDYYHTCISGFKLEFSNFTVLTEQTHSSEKVLKISFQKLREAYKKTEFLLTYFDEGSAKLINAAPLPRVDVSNAQFITLEPGGLQIIEEVLYSESIDRDELLLKCIETKKYIDQIDLGAHLNSAFTKQNLYVSAHRGIMRNLILGISGFDVPASGNAISETARGLASIQELLNLYSGSIPKDELSRFNKKIENAIKYLNKHQDFETFNRFEFIRDFGNPLLSAFVDLGIAWNEIRLNQIIVNRSSINPFAKNLFAEDFLNPLAFSSDPGDTLSEARTTLGKYLFFDPILSEGNTRSCASCHKPELAFTDGRAKSLAFDTSENLGRNAPSLLNSAYQNAQFWDLREELLEDQIDHVLSNGKEFHSNYASLISKLSKSTEYDSLFSICLWKARAKY